MQETDFSAHLLKKTSRLIQLVHRRLNTTNAHRIKGSKTESKRTFARFKNGAALLYRLMAIATYASAMHST